MTVTPERSVIDGDKLDEQAAKALDGMIKEAIGKLADDSYDVIRLLKRAKDGQIHEALGLPSWTAYLKDAVRVVPTDKTQRKMLAALLSSEGAGQRAIADVLGCDQKTVSNDLRSGEENSSTATAGLDGKSYKRKPKGAAAKPKVTQPLNIAVSDAVAALNKAVDGITSIADDDRFTANRDKFVSRRPDLQRAIATLQKVVDMLNGDDSAEAQS